MRAQRKQKIETMLGKKPSQNAEDPKDLADIESAKNNMGDYKLKTDKNYVVPEDQRVNAEKKRREAAWEAATAARSWCIRIVRRFVGGG